MGSPSTENKRIKPSSSELLSSVELNQLEEVRLLLRDGANPEQRFLRTFGQHYLSERAILNQNDEVANLLLYNRHPSPEETLGIIRAAILTQNYEWIERYGEGVPLDIIINLTIKYASRLIFGRLYQRGLRDLPDTLQQSKIQEWYRKARDYKQVESISMIYHQTQIPMTMTTFKEVVKSKDGYDPKLIKACLNTNLDLSEGVDYLINRPQLLLIILIRSDYLSGEYWLIERMLEMKYSPNVGASLMYAFIYGCPYPDSFDLSSSNANNQEEAQAILLFLHLLKSSGSLGLKYLWSKLSPSSVRKFSRKFNPDIPLVSSYGLGFNYRMKYLIEQTGLSVYPYLLVVDYLLYHKIRPDSETIRSTLVNGYQRLQVEHSFIWPFNSSDDNSSDNSSEVKSRLLKRTQHEKAYTESRRRILRQIDYCSCYS